MTEDGSIVLGGHRAVEGGFAAVMLDSDGGVVWQWEVRNHVGNGCFGLIYARGIGGAIKLIRRMCLVFEICVWVRTVLHRGL